MQVNITFRHLDSTEALKAHARDKVQHIQRYIDRPTEAHVVLYVENLEHKADINLKAGPFLLRGRAKSGDMYASIVRAVEKIERQAIKNKTRLIETKRQKAKNRSVEQKGGIRRSATFSLICGAFSTASPYVSSDIGAIEPGWWHSWHFCWRMGAMSLAYVTARCALAAAGRGP